MARHLGTDHTTSIVTGDDVRDRITAIAAALDQPSVDGVNSYFVSLAARRGVTVAVSGTGADELFAGYPWFITMARETERWAREPWRALAGSMVAAAARHPAFDRLLRRRGGGRVHRLRRGGFVGAYGETYQIFGPVGAARLLAPGVAAGAGAGAPPHRDLTRLDELARGSAIERVTALATRGYLTNQLLRDIDAVSMAHSLEVRVPYLDHRSRRHGAVAARRGKARRRRTTRTRTADVSRKRERSACSSSRSPLVPAGLRYAAEARLRDAVRCVASRATGVTSFDDTLDDGGEASRLSSSLPASSGARPVPTRAKHDGRSRGSS